MHQPFMFSGKGQALRKVTASTGNSLSMPETTTIPDGGYTEIVAGHDCSELIFLLEFAAAATGTFVVEEVLDISASVAGEIFDTITVTAERVGRWNAGERLPGYFRLKNSSGQNVVIYLQKAP